jgi:hypothetical protein
MRRGGEMYLSRRQKGRKKKKKKGHLLFPFSEDAATSP